ncbi:hypothetical protein AAZU54_03725 [Pseudomonas sp. Je.1.5.c]|uniref:hypothetical protein n=1 Tax=Pseudomonas sp. Je.1.5.c TaxID=3142839 RepID=UPI003DAA27C3
MTPLFNHPEFSSLLLTVTAALREVEIDDVADLFKDSIFDRSLVEPAIEALRRRVKNSHSAFAQDTALRLLQRLNRCIQLNRVSL